MHNAEVCKVLPSMLDVSIGEEVGLGLGLGLGLGR